MVLLAKNGVPWDLAELMDYDELEAFAVLIGRSEDPSAEYDWQAHRWIKGDT